ncbi:MAG: hypothetical protein ACK5MZ_08020 [Aestuariibaculum sp.]
MYTIGWFLGKLFPKNYPYKTYHGIIILFAVLIFAIFIGCFVLGLMPNNDMNAITDVFPVLLIFLIFGGLPTFIIGIWLGKKLRV